MDFFDPQVKESAFHPNFSSVLFPNRWPERDLFQEWAKGFVNRDDKLVKEFQTTFNSTFWEVYLHAVFKEYGFVADWTHSAPDFSINANGEDILIEAVTANAAQGKPNEWEKTFDPEELGKLRRFKELNTEAIIRLSNSITSKYLAYKENYRKLDHVKGKPFVLAIAPFEQPHFNLQYDRPIQALLYDYYVDEDAYLDDPDSYPNGAPGVSLGFVEKQNGAEIELGIFNDSLMSEISAVVFSCVATWGKLSAMSTNNERVTIVRSTWAQPPNGEPAARACKAEEHDETILDGLQVFHNPYAQHPLNPEIFRADRVIQNYLNFSSGKWEHEGEIDSLQFRSVMTFNKTDSFS